MAVQQHKDRPNSAWPIGSRFDLLDAYMRNPIEVKRLAVKTTDFWIVGEDASGVRHFAHTDRVASPARYEKSIKDVSPVGTFDDLLGLDESSKADIFEELL